MTLVFAPVTALCSPHPSNPHVHHLPVLLQAPSQAPSRLFLHRVVSLLFLPPCSSLFDVVAFALIAYSFLLLPHPCLASFSRLIWSCPAWLVSPPHTDSQTCLDSTDRSAGLPYHERAPAHQIFMATARTVSMSMGTIRRDHDTCAQEGERDYPRVLPYDTLDAATTIIYIYIYIWTTLGVLSLHA